MFNLIKTLFTPKTAPDYSKLAQTTTKTRATIDDNNNLFAPDGTFVASYSRRRDAIRGATRRGFKVA